MSMVDIDVAAFVADIGSALVERSRALPESGTIHVSSVTFVIEYDGTFEEIDVSLRRQGHNSEYPLAIAVSDA